jgi:hypothetical protein
MHAHSLGMVRPALAHPWRRAAIVTVAAYALALQALLSGLGGALHPRAGGPPLCSPLEHASSAPGGGAPAAHADLCCVLACHAPALGCAGVAQGATAAHGLRGANLPLPEPAFEVASRKLRPVGSRAPPVAA